MMTYKTILVHMDDSKHCAARVSLAARMAGDFAAHLIGLYATDPFELYGLTDWSYAGKLTQYQRTAEERKVGAHELLHAQASAQGIDGVEFRSADTMTVEAVILHARYADLLVIGQTDPGEPSGVAPAFPGLVALSVGRPVLVVPYYAQAFPRVGQNLLVAWSPAREAARAVTDALPFLKKAKKVVVMCVNPAVARDEHGEVPGADIALYLARHGIQVEVMQTHTEIEVGDELLSRAFDLEIDLIVMGAYGHSRLREVVLGGVTQSMLKHMTAPVLMSH